MCGGDEESGKKYGSWTDRGGQKRSSLRHAGRRRSASREREKKYERRRRETARRKREVVSRKVNLRKKRSSRVRNAENAGKRGQKQGIVGGKENGKRRQ